MSTINTDREEKFMKVMGDKVDKRVLSFMVNSGFLTAPASTKYHGAYKGGLFDHSLAVVSSLVELTEAMNLNWLNYRSPYVIGMFHDACKIESYIPSEKVDHFDEATQKWAHSYAYNPNTLMPGHGDKSVIIMSQVMELTEEELLCIRWHMGAYDDKSNWEYYDRAIRKYPNVLYTHTADMIASKIKGV